MICEDDFSRPHTAEENVKLKEQHFPDFLCTRLSEKDHNWLAPSKMNDLCLMINSERIQSAWDNVFKTLCIRFNHEIPARLHENADNHGAKIHPSWHSKNSQYCYLCHTCNPTRAISALFSK